MQSILGSQSSLSTRHTRHTLRTLPAPRNLSQAQSTKPRPAANNSSFHSAACSPKLAALTPLRPYWGQLPQHRGFDIRPASNEQQHGMVNSLVRRMYAWRGYDTTGIRLRPNDPDRITLAAWRFDEVVATLTVTRDSRQGLLADALYKGEIDGLRDEQGVLTRVVCEVSKLAVDPDFSSKELLASLFRAAHRHARLQFGASDAVIEVNPRHARYYERWFGFQQLGELKQCARVNAPAVLLHQKLDGMEGFEAFEKLDYLAGSLERSALASAAPPASVSASSPKTIGSLSTAAM